MYTQCRIEIAETRPHFYTMDDQLTAVVSATNDQSQGVLSPEAIDEIAVLATRQNKAQSLLLKAVNFVGGQVEDGLRLLPDATRAQLNEVARSALRHSYDVAAKSRGGIGGKVGSDRMHKALSALSGAIGGMGGLSTAIVELPVATTMIFRAVQGVAAEHGEDPLAEETRLECLAVFGSGGRQTDDDGVDTAFLGARLSLSGTALNAMITRIAPKFAAVLSQKLAAQAVPVLGAAAGAGTNYAFVDYYVSLAHVHFGLRKLARQHGEDAVTDEFHRALAAQLLPKT